MSNPDRSTADARGYRPGCLALAFLLGCSLGWACVSLFSQAKSTRLRFEGEAEVTALLLGQAQDWNRGDLDGFMTGYWESDDLRFYSGGAVTTGWQATFARYTKRYKSEGKEMGTLTFSDVDVEATGTDSAFARGRWKVVTSKETFEGLFTLVLKRFPDGWKIIHDHTSVADKP